MDSDASLVSSRPSSPEPDDLFLPARSKSSGGSGFTGGTVSSSTPSDCPPERSAELRGAMGAAGAHPGDKLGGGGFKSSSSSTSSSTSSAAASPALPRFHLLSAERWSPTRIQLGASAEDQPREATPATGIATVFPAERCGSVWRGIR
ncbi:hypothetical protein E2I00_001467 [Balaenoptera physalus]|uniref:Uncharacterized protein n=1 Tax=Balaenoptera physalus TaxID=9770 RepID=A0A6A1Q9P8_BALPH|nr:hypothetical protein E2I00_001467 [Balaenoptera physalus]